MWSQLFGPLFYIFAFLGMVSSMEFHPEHVAFHQTGLSRRSPPTSLLKEDGKMQVAVSAHNQRIVNLSTELVDQRTEYIGVIGVGTNSDGKSQFEAKVVFDTGSTNLWVASSLCSSFSARKSYNPTESLTQEAFKGQSTDIDIQFGTGELKGPIHVDTYHVGPMVVKQQPFAMIREMQGSVFWSFDFEGILGLGFKSLSFGGIEPFFERVIAQKVLPSNEFAFFLNVDSKKPSTLLWGGIDKDLYHGPILMFPVIQPHYWALELVDFKVGNTSMKSTDPDRAVRRLIVDSGTTYFTAPSHMLGQVTGKLHAGDCSKVTDHPDLTYVLRGADNKTYDLVVTQETYMIQDGGSYCTAAFMPLDVDKEFGPAMLLGEVFMRHFFTVFSRGDGNDANAKLGIALANTDANPKVKSSQEASPQESMPVFLQPDQAKAAQSDRKRISIGLDSQAHAQKARSRSRPRALLRSDPH